MTRHLTQAMTVGIRLDDKNKFGLRSKCALYRINIRAELREIYFNPRVMHVIFVAR